MVRPRFSIRAFLGFVTLVALTCWLYPAACRGWIEYRLRAIADQFKQAQITSHYQLDSDGLEPHNLGRNDDVASLALKGSVSLELGTETLQADRARIWFVETSRDRAWSAVYVEGNVIVAEYRYPAIYFDAANNRAKVIDEIDESQDFESRARAARKKYQR